MQRTMFWYLRVAASAFGLSASAILIVLAVRSYYFEDRTSGHLNDVSVRLYSSRGWIVCSRNSESGVTEKYPWTLQLGAEHWLSPGDDRLAWNSPTQLLRQSGFASASAPHWSLVLAGTALAVLLKPRPRFRFSLAELLIVTTVATAVFAGVATLARLAQ